jgi:hypothetical protein
MTKDDILRMARDTGSIDSNEVIETMYNAFTDSVRKAMMQLFTDPENQPTQHGTVTLEFMQREIEAEREACAALAEKEAQYSVATAIRERSLS